jgi:phage antirepressor YoqD-like protein
MNQQLIIKGEQEFLGIKIPVIEGGFGENKKVMLASTIAEIHGTQLKHVNELINRKLDEFEFGIDILDLCGSEELRVASYDLGLITSNGQKYCYLLSEQGYMLLAGFMKTDKAREIRKQLRREYFAMREVINSDEQLKAQCLVAIYNGGQEGVLASKQLAELEKKPLLKKIEEDKPLVDFAIQVSKTSNSITMAQFAKLIKDEKIKIGRNKLFEWFRNNEYLRHNNEPYQRYMEYFETKESVYQTPYGSKSSVQTLVNAKGQIYFVEKLRKEFCKDE